MERVKILIADDIGQSLNNLKNIIEKADNVEILGTANDGQEVYNKIIELQPDLVFTANQMPKMTGIEVVEKVKDDTTILKKPAFILVTEDRDYSIYQKASELNICAIIDKPYNSDKILNFISEYFDSQNEEIQEKTIEKNKIAEKENLIRKLIKKFNKGKRQMLNNEFDYEKWFEKYHNDEIIDLEQYFTIQDFNIIKKLGIKIKDKIYTGYEFEVLSLEISKYYKDEDMTEEDLEFSKNLEETGVSEEYEKLLKKFEKINEIYKF